MLFLDIHVTYHTRFAKARIELKLGNFVVNQDLEELAMLRHMPCFKICMRILPCYHYHVYIVVLNVSLLISARNETSKLKINVKRKLCLLLSVDLRSYQLTEPLISRLIEVLVD